MHVKALDIIETCIAGYEKKAAAATGEDQKEKYNEYVDHLRVAKKEIQRIIPTCTIYTDSKYVCPNCKGDVTEVFDVAEKINQIMEFCPWCGQSISAFIKIE